MNEVSREVGVCSACPGKRPPIRCSKLGGKTCDRWPPRSCGPPRPPRACIHAVLGDDKIYPASKCPWLALLRWPPPPARSSNTHCPWECGCSCACQRIRCCPDTRPPKKPTAKHSRTRSCPHPFQQ